LYYKQIVGDILAFGGQGTGGAAEALVKHMVNVLYFRVMENIETPYEDREFTLSSVAGIAQQGMPLWVRKILNVEDPTTPRRVRESSARAFDKAEPGRTTQDTPFEYYVLQSRGVQKQPSVDSVLTLVSDNAGDAAANYKVRVEGFDTNGNLVSELVTMNGTTSVDTTTIFDSTLGVERIVKAPATGVTFSGSITVTDSAANTLAVIPVAWDSPEYIWIEWNPIPAAVIEYTVRAELRVPPLMNDYDWPKFDEQYHDLLIWGVTQDLLAAWGKNDTAGAHRLTFKERMDEFQGRATSAPASIHVFSNVQAYATGYQRPGRPLIKGVDFGLAS
jgi:hypothetical protein